MYFRIFMLSFKQNEIKVDLTGKMNGNEIYTATEVVRNFSAIIDRLKKNESEKIVVLKNNKFEAVILSVEEFERLQNAVELLENIYNNQKA